MAEINIEKKKPIWPWIIIILIILAAIYFFWVYTDRDHTYNNEEMLQTDTISQLDENSVYDNTLTDSTTLYTGSYGTIRHERALADYFGFVENKNNMALDHEYYRTALFKLITATKREAEIKNVDVDAHIEAAMESAEMVTNDPASTKDSATGNHTNKIKDAADHIAQALQTIQQKEFDNLSNEANEVQLAVADIDVDASGDQNQRDINIFFDKSARLLQKMYEAENNNQ